MVTDLSLITSGYSSLNGLSGAYGSYGGYGGYGVGYGGLFSTANAEEAKERIANNYDVYATQQSYRGKQGVESINHNQECALLYSDLTNGELDRAADRFETMVEQMKNSAQFAGYSDSEIRSLIRNQYTTATGSDLVTDIKENASNGFVQGVLRTNPITGLFVQANSEADLISKVTGAQKTANEKLERVLGDAVGASASAGAIYGAVKAATNSYKSDGLVKKGLDFVSKSKGTKIGLAVAAGTALVAGIASIFANKSSKTNTN